MGFLQNKTARRPSRTTKQRGDAAEDALLDHLQAAGLRLVARNYRTPGRGSGEIDLVMRDPRDGTLVFVEVRQRAVSAHDGAAGSITGVKRRRIIFAARHFLQRAARDAALPCRRGAEQRGPSGSRVRSTRAQAPDPQEPGGCAGTPQH
jgi:putative endonuclease